MNNLSKSSVKGEIEEVQSLQFWSIFGANVPPKIEKYCKKPNFPKNCILRTIRLRNSHFPDKSQNSYKNYQKNSFFGLFKVQKRSIIKDQKVRHPVTIALLESPNPVLTASGRIVFIAGLKLDLF